MSKNLPPSKLKSLNLPSGDWVIDVDSGVHVYHVDSPHSMIQAAGYLKYVLAKEGECNVYFRGQSEIYPTLSPTLYRCKDKITQKQKSTRDDNLNKYKKSSENLILQNIDAHVKEPLLQHYGIKTKWLDVVDNIWVALWFACNNPITKGKNSKYLCFQRREFDAPARKTEVSSSAPIIKDDFAYIYLIQAGTNPSRGMPGCFSGCGTELIDLRVAAPSIFLRPHAQHGLLFTRSSHNDHKNTDYSDFVAGIIRVNLSSALAWLGNGKLLDTHSLFPPPIYDFGYMQLLESAPEGNELIGDIHIVCA